MIRVLLLPMLPKIEQAFVALALQVNAQCTCVLEPHLANAARKRSLTSVHAHVGPQVHTLIKAFVADTTLELRFARVRVLMAYSRPLVFVDTVASREGAHVLLPLLPLNTRRLFSFYLRERQKRSHSFFT